MFTGIIEEVGKVIRVTRKGNLRVFEITARKVNSGAGTGDSIAVNGVCLTLTGKWDNTLTFDVMEETVSRTNLKGARTGAAVNLERSLKANGTVSGHFVYGHIDGTRRIAGVNKGLGTGYIDVALEREDIKFVVEKGSIAIDGVSLTIGKIYCGKIRIFLIPHTWGHTTLSRNRAGDRVNVEFDMLARFAARQGRPLLRKLPLG